MMLKRKLQEEEKEGGSGFLARGSKGGPHNNYWRNVTEGWSLEEFASLLEPLFQKVVCFSYESPAGFLEKNSSLVLHKLFDDFMVSEEVGRAMLRFLDPSLRALSNHAGTSETSSLQLQFVTKLPTMIFTSSQIEAEDGSPLRIELVDGRTNERVTSGPLSSVKIEIVVLNGDFGSDEEEDWTEKEFNCNITRAREGKRPLITGELTLVLQGGVGCLRDLIITDNSSWMRSRKFRLGARAVQKVSAETRIREARSEAFVVKDHRGELYKKHHPPSPSDEVWRLEKIAKDGALHQRMTSSGINTVRDFVQLYEADASSLRNILGNGIPKRTWETIVRHASTCVVDDNEMYAFHQASNKDSVLFNSVMKVDRATLNGQSYQSVDTLTHSQKILVQNSKRQAYDNKNQWVPLYALPGIAHLRAQANLPPEPSIGLSPPLHHLYYTELNQDKPEVTSEFNCSLASTLQGYGVTEERQLDCLELQSHIATKIFNPTA